MAQPGERPVWRVVHYVLGGKEIPFMTMVCEFFTLTVVILCLCSSSINSVRYYMDLVGE